jgi:hypothetical protein
MKTIVTVVSSLLIGLTLANSNFNPIHELQIFLMNKKRIFMSLGLAVTGYILAVAGLLISLVEWALQSDAQGFVIWSAMFTVASGLAIAGLCFILIARAAVPARVEYHESIFQELNKQFHFTEGLEVLLKKMAEPRDEASAHRAPVDEKFAETRRHSEPVFRDTPTADVLHH